MFSSWKLALMLWICRRSLYFMASSRPNDQQAIRKHLARSWISPGNHKLYTMLGIAETLDNLNNFRKTYIQLHDPHSCKTVYELCQGSSVQWSIKWTLNQLSWLCVLGKVTWPSFNVFCKRGKMVQYPPRKAVVKNKWVNTFSYNSAWHIISMIC